MKMMLRHSVARNAFALGIMQIVNFMVPLLVLPYLTRTIGVEAFGVVMVAMASIQFSYVISDYGFSFSATYSISKKQSNINYINSLLARIFSAKIILIFIALFLLLVVSFLPIYVGYQDVFFAGFLAVIAQAFQPVWLFQGLERMKNFTIYMAATKILYVGLVLSLVSGENDAWLVLLSWSIANLFGAIIGMYMVTLLGYRISFSGLTDAVYELRVSAQYFWSRLAVAFYTSASSIIVGSVNLNQVAMYSCSEQIYKAGQAVSNPINQALYPYMAKEKNWKLFLKIILAMVLILSLGSFFVYLFSGFIVTLIFGETYLSSIPVLSVFLITLIINYLGVSFGYPACAAIERPDIANNTVMIGSLLFGGAVFILYMTNAISALNIAMSVLITEVFVAVLRIIWVLKVAQKNILV